MNNRLKIKKYKRIFKIIQIIIIETNTIEDYFKMLSNGTNKIYKWNL